MNRTTILLVLFIAGERAGAGEGNPALPFVRKYCVSCHDSTKKKGEVDLSRFATEESLVGSRKLWLAAIRHVKNGEMPPRSVPQPTPDEREEFADRIRGVFRKADVGKPIDPGRIPIRRLNRTEYNNTIRDLCLIEFEPAENFPPDDPSHGFDNIAEALTLSPLLMERYLDAAEAIVARTIVTDKPVSPTVRFGFDQFINKGTNRPYRVFLFTSEPLVTEYRLAADGDYVLRVEGRPTTKEIPPIKMALLIDGKEVERLRFAIPAKGNTTKLEVPLVLTKGKRRVSLAMLNPARDTETKKSSLPHRVDGQNKENYAGLELYKFDLVGPTTHPAEGQRRILACDPKAKSDEQAKEILARFVSRAFRRPASTVETARYVKLYQRSRQAGQAFEQAIGTALQAILVSPNFLFRFELDNRTSPAGPQPISEHHLASRLSYFLWSSMPDDELLDQAAKGTLAKNLDAQVARMLADAKSDAFVENFATQWLAITGMDRVNRGEQFDILMRQAMTRESILFFDAVLRENRPITDFLDGQYTFVNERLARHYGLGNFAKDKPSDVVIPAYAYVKLSLPPDGPRGGILTHASVLTMTSSPDRTSPVKRGMWILDNILASPPPPPPPNVPPLEEAGGKIKDGLPLRTRLELHRSKTECAACHAKIDPLGFALEKFDMLGKFRDKDGRKAIDDQIELPDGRKFQGGAGLRKVLVEKKDAFARCLTEKMLIYALGRGLDENDVPTTDAIVLTLAKDGYRFQTLIREVIRSAPFRYQRGAGKEKK